MRDRGRLALATGVILVGAVAVAAAMGVVLPLAGVVAVAIVLVAVVLVASAHEPVALAILAMPTLVSVQRIGGSVNLSISDFVLFALFWLVAFLGPRPFTGVLRTLLWYTVVYQAATFLTLLVNPYAANVVEWFHAWLLTGGALVVGWAVGRSGHASAGLALLVAPCAGIGVLAIAAAVRMLASGSLQPVYLNWPYGMHKNYIGTTLVFAAAVTYARPSWLRWPRWVSNGLFGILVLGIGASQARQALVSLGVVVAVIALRRSAGAGRSRVILLPMVVVMGVVAAAVRSQVDSSNAYNSANQRLAWYADSVDVWQHQPWFGVGLRWWYTQRFPIRFQPPNAELEVLTSAGVVGLIAFAIMCVGVLVTLWHRVPPEYGTLAFVAVLARLVQGQLDLFWVAVSVSVPFLVAGMCVGAAALHEARPPALTSITGRARHRLAVAT